NPRRYKLITENDVQLCRLNHTKTVVSKIMNSKYLRRWEHHHLILGNSEIFSTSPSGFMESSIPYSSILDINVISRWDAGQKFCIRLTIADGSVLLQASNSYLRDQWLHSIQWKRYISKYDKLLRNTKRPDVLTKEIKQLIDLSLTTPIQDDSVNQFPLDLVSLLLKEVNSINHVAYEQIIIALAPLLEKNHPTQQMCDFFTKHCKHSPRSRATVELFTPVIFRILKHNVDFGRYVRMQVFIQEYIQALRSQNGGSQIVREFIKSLHGPSTTCPHPRVLPNLVAVCFSTVFSYYEDRKKRLLMCMCVCACVCMTQSSSTPAAVGAATTTATNINEHISDDDDDDDGGCKYIGRNKIKRNHHHRRRHRHHRHHHQRRLPDDDVADDGDDGNDDDERLLTYIDILRFMSEFDDWRLQLAILLQPIPFPDDALAHRLFTNRMKPLLHNLASDERCDVHSSILGLREEKAGWFDVYCPGGIASEDDDDDELYTVMLMKLIRCCCRRKKFFYTHIKMISAWQLLAVRGNEAAIEALCLVLEFEICEKEDNKLQTIATLQNTSVGKKMYNELCQRQIQLQEIQQKGGPKRLTLPSRSTDDDLRRMLSSGAFGNLECLTLAFTQVTSACALDLIKLPSLRYLNLWSTQFGDTGLQVISEYMPKLQVLNLCETPVTDKGLSCLSAMRNLRKLNLNSTHLSAPTFQELKEKLPSLIECDVKYTDAW
ncbi:hypothetical protein HELRODRAFT_88288, partial [Helobdella robusta]|uniref:C-Maf-inducing protein PH domain-containing protein n=1 Tax=Helobdella robusta TaxID=6412 RepID=T1G711_HELRO